MIYGMFTDTSIKGRNLDSVNKDGWTLCSVSTFVVDFGAESFYVFLIEINFIVGAFTGFLFFFHFDNILKGRITPEKKENNKGTSYHKGWKQNIIEVFGINWYLTCISPFIHSPLPGNGIDWFVNDKKK
ncbi:putative palmitoyltransferase ZDHHC24 [Danaus plexippus plexippus]|uniref:Palmitoyltransferase ZDHHC24 n=1 Tax=Danaus plexippus plexippus TaxID=278856 RepID=A0A212FAR1_DANPL|nr:putative palmitoyltransferase ZDHHC24 [Danaus plexippus plexippus]